MENDKMANDKYVQANHAMWNRTADIYRDEGFAKFLAKISQPDFTTFDEVEQQLFSSIGLAGKDVAQLGCNNGRELISVKRAGAGRCVGFDVSEKMLEQAEQLSRASAQSLHFVCSSVYSIDEAYTGAFDVVYVTVGVLGWLPDLPAFFGVAQRLLRPGGSLFLYDQHPILGMFDPVKEEIDSSYFRQDPFVEESLPDYMDTAQTGRAESYWFQHTLSSILGLCLESNLNLTHFEEYGHDLSNTYRAFETHEHRLPLSYSLLAQKV